MTDSLNLLPAALAAVAPRVDATVWTAALTPPMRVSGIVTPLRIAAFLGQVAEESEGFTWLVESLFYSDAQRIYDMWPSHFADASAAAPYVANPQRLANRVYANRNGNGDEASGDGWLYRGRGLIQLTGRAAYGQFALAMGRNVPDVLTWITTPAGAAASACWFWNLCRLNPLADAWGIAAITRKINGGETNLAGRVALSDAALRAMGGTVPGTPAPTNDSDNSADDLNAKWQAAHPQA